MQVGVLDSCDEAIRSGWGVNYQVADRATLHQMQDWWPPGWSRQSSENLSVQLTGGLRFGELTSFLRKHYTKGTMDLEHLMIRLRQRDKLPIPKSRYRQWYFSDDQHSLYWHSGFLEYVNIRSTLLAHGLDVAREPGLVYVDIGGSSGRLSRQWAVQHPSATVLTTELNRGDVGFLCRHNIGRALVNSYLPPIAGLPDGSVSVLTSMSVFTHLTHKAMMAWLREVKRVLKPGGFAWLTIHGDDTWRRIKDGDETDGIWNAIKHFRELVPDEHGHERKMLPNLRSWLFSSRDKIPPGVVALAIPHSNAGFETGLRGGQISPGVGPYASKSRGDEARFIQTFVSYDFVRKYWSKELDIVAILPQSSGRPRQEWECGTPACVRDAQLRPKNLPIGQDVVLLRKPP